MTDPIATLHAYFTGTGFAGADAHIDAALAELERRARIEARLDKWLAADPFHDARFLRKKDGSYAVRLIIRWATPWVDFHAGAGPEYHTALEAALNAAGAP